MSDTAIAAAIRHQARQAIRLFTSTRPSSRRLAVATAAGVWRNFPLYGETVACHPALTDAEKRSLRHELDDVHRHAADVLMREAERAGLNSFLLAEERRVCQELFWPISTPASPSGPFGVRWFHGPDRLHDEWPDCLGSWRYVLPPTMQEAIRQGEEVFGRLVASIGPEFLERTSQPVFMPMPAKKSGGRPKVGGALKEIYDHIRRVAAEEPATTSPPMIERRLSKAQNRDVMAAVRNYIALNPRNRKGEKQTVQGVIAAAKPRKRKRG